MRRSYLLPSAVALLLLVQAAMEAESTDCVIAELAPCRDALSTGQPSAECCAKLKELQPCLCQFIKDPNFGKLIDSEEGRRIAAACNVPIPNCVLNLYP